MNKYMYIELPLRNCSRFATVKFVNGHRPSKSIMVMDFFQGNGVHAKNFHEGAYGLIFNVHDNFQLCFKTAFGVIIVKVQEMQVRTLFGNTQEQHQWQTSSLN